MPNNCSTKLIHYVAKFFSHWMYCNISGTNTIPSWPKAWKKVSHIFSPEPNSFSTSKHKYLCKAVNIPSPRLSSRVDLMAWTYSFKLLSGEIFLNTIWLLPRRTLRNSVWLVELSVFRSEEFFAKNMLLLPRLSLVVSLRATVSP